jgi:hypothetical protein
VDVAALVLRRKSRQREGVQEAADSGLGNQAGHGGRVSAGYRGGIRNSVMTDQATSSKCRQCGGEIFWHKAKSGKFYPADSATDRRAFHECDGAAPTPSAALRPAAAPAPAPLGASLSERVDALEATVSALVRQLREVGSRVPIDNRDVPFRE